MPNSNSRSIGRIGGPLLESNLVRNGRDLAFENDLLYFDVTSGQIGVRRDTPDHPLSVSGTSRFPHLDIDQFARIDNITINNNNVFSPTVGNIFINSPVTKLDRDFLQLDQFVLNDNEIILTEPDTDFIISTSGAGSIHFFNSVKFFQNSTVEKNLNVDNDLIIAGDLVGFGDQITDIVTFESRIVEDVKPTQTEVFNIGADGLLWKTVWTSTVVIDQTRITNSTIETKDQNATLVLTANGIGFVNVENIEIEQNTVRTVSKDLRFQVGEKFVLSNTDVIIVPRGTTQEKTQFNIGDFRLDTTESVFEGYYTSRVGFGGVFSDDKQTSVTAHPFDDQLTFTINGIEVGKFVDESDRALIIHRLMSEENLFFRDNLVSTQEQGDSTLQNLELVTSGTGRVIVDDVTKFNESQFVNLSDDPLTLRNTGTGYVAFVSSEAIMVPFGPTVDTEDSTFIELGDTRWNTDLDRLEIFDGENYVPAAGGGETVTSEFMQDLSDEWSLILG